MTKELLELCLSERYNKSPELFLGWLVEMFLKTKAEQKAEFDLWVADRKTRIQAELNALDAKKIAMQDLLTAELDKLNAV